MKHSVDGMGSESAAAVLGNDGHLHIASQPDNLLDEVATERRRPASLTGAQQEDLSDPLPPREADECFSNILALQYPSFNPQVSGKIQLLLDRLPFRTGQ